MNRLVLPDEKTKRTNMVLAEKIQAAEKKKETLDKSQTYATLCSVS